MSRERLLRGNIFARAFEGVALAVGAMRASKTRAVLTILGVAIGVMVVIAMASMITGIKDSVSNIIMQSGPNTFYVMRYFRAGIDLRPLANYAQYVKSSGSWRPGHSDRAERRLPAQSLAAQPSGTVFSPGGSCA